MLVGMAIIRYYPVNSIRVAKAAYAEAGAAATIGEC
jgi:hypothetical protein